MDLERLAHGRFTHIEWVSKTGSTNVDLVEWAEREPRRPAVRFADLQTAGRGRRNRSWEMGAGGGLLVSFYVPWSSADSAHAVPTALGVATVAAIESIGLRTFLKWPNDIVAGDDRKIGGMLSEVTTVSGTFGGVVAGLGCNVHWPDPTMERAPGLENAVSLDELSGTRVDRATLAEALVSAFDGQLEFVERHGLSALQDRYRQRCSTIGRHVRVDTGAAGVVEGQATDVSPDGALIVVVDGVQRRVDVGDVVHLRPGAG